MMSRPHFRTTADVFAVVKPDEKGTFTCPIKGCSKRDHANSKDFGRHLAVAHKIPSPKHNGKSVKKVRATAGLPVLTIKHCPNCGFNIEEFEQAAVLLRKTGAGLNK